MKKLLVGLLAFAVVGAATAAPPSPRQCNSSCYQRHKAPKTACHHQKRNCRGYYRTQGPRHGYYRTHGTRHATYHFGSNRY